MSEVELSSDSVCGKTMLNIVGHGNSVLAEIQRLADHVPKQFYLNPQQLGNEYKGYCNIILDFSYNKYRQKCDEVIQKNSMLLDLDESFKTIYFPTIERYYSLFCNLVRYYSEIVKFLKDLKDGVVFVDQNLEKLFKNRMGKQLLCEMMYLYGVMLILMDLKIPGIIRERLLIAFYRYKKGGEYDASEFLEVCKLCKRTEVKIKRRFQRPPDYPCNYFARAKFPKEFLDLVISKLRTDDIYNQTSYYPFHHHRTTALANQAGILYVMLYFKPEMLKTKMADMRSIVDNLFNDNWVVSYYLGFYVDLSEEWQRFKAAKAAINNIVVPLTAKKLAISKYVEVDANLKDLSKVLTEGVITEEYVLDNIEHQLKIIRKCNITLRWLLLHRACRNPKIQKIILENSNDQKILLLLLNVAQFEFILNTMFEEMLKVKEEKWKNTKSEATKRMKELSSYFSGEQKLSTTKDEQLQEWFDYISKKIDEIDYSDTVKAGNKLHEMITALKEVEEFKNIYNSLQVKQYLLETRDLLKKMIRYVNIQEEVLYTIAVLSDISYGWKIIHSYIPLMQQRIVNNPGLIIKMRSTFIKLVTMMDIPCVRIKDAGVKADLVSVSAYYSKELVKFVRKVLEIIPKSMFSIVHKVISIHTDTLSDLPTKFNRDDLKSIAKLGIRNELAKYTYKISEFTEGVLAMKETLFGIVKVDPKKLLEDGIRKELVKQISDILERSLDFKPKSTIQEFESQMRALAGTLNGIRRSFEYIQDYILVYGLKLWHEELSRIINYNVEMECNRSLKYKVQDWQSRYQSTVIPIPTYKSQDQDTNNFMGRLVREMFVQTDPRYFTYFEKLSGWYDVAGKENIGNRHFSLLEKSVGMFGLKGIDTVVSFGVVKMLKKFIIVYESFFEKTQKIAEYLAKTRESISPFTSTSPSFVKIYNGVVGKLSKQLNVFAATIVRIGRSQLIRKHICYTLDFSCKMNANLLYKSLKTLNKTILSEIDENETKSEVDDKFDEVAIQNDLNPLLSELEEYLEQSGLTNPLEKIYLTHKSLQHLGLIMGFILISQLNKFYYDKIFCTYIKIKKKEFLDFNAFTMGIITVLKQFHVDEVKKFFSCLAQYVRSMMDKINNSKVDTLNEGVKFILRFVLNYCRLTKQKVKSINNFFPDYYFSMLE